MTDVGVISQFLHPPVGLCVREALAGNPYGSGVHGLTRVRGPLNVDAFGLAWDTLTAPPGYGRSDGPSVDFYDRTLLMIGQFQRLLDGTLICNQQDEFNVPQGYIMFTEAFPYVVDVLISPGVTVKLYWLLLL